jgi:tRNA(Met) cytidine acetyltransferase
VPGAQAARDLCQLTADLHRRAATDHHRNLLLIAGSPAWCRMAAAAALDDHDRLWIGTTAADAGPVMPASRARTLLGGEWLDAVYDAHAGLDVDALAAVAGTLRGGGLLLLLVPPLDAWPTRPDPALARLLSSPASPADAAGRFVTRLVDLLQVSVGVTVCTEGAPLPRVERPESNSAPVTRPDADGCLGDDQRRAVDAVVAAATGQPAVLTADRGRGKSAALGLAAARLLTTRPLGIVVTAPRRSAASALFRHAAERLGLPHAQGDLETANGGWLRFVAPDRLLREPHAADLVLVDEAAAIPTPLLERLLRRDHRVAFATTVHGYEGTGRGFALRFRATLDRLAPGWQEVNLHTPVRWAPDDPLEAWLNATLLLDAEPSPDAPGPGTLHCTRLDRDDLLADASLLRELFGLLVQAHYRTTPADLRQLLDAPAVTVHVARLAGALAGVAVCVDEGRLEASLAFAVWAGHRRLRGHLVAQSLASHAGLKDAPRLGYRRVQRIAVHPRARRRGVGRALLEAVEASAREQGHDVVATSFGMTPDLVAFWSACGFDAARVGLRREAASGAHALMMLRPLTPAGKALRAAATQRLGRALPALLEGPLADLESELAGDLAGLLPDPGTDTAPSADDWAEAAAFAFAARGPDAAYSALRRVTLALLTDGRGSVGPQLAALRARYVDAAPWTEIVTALGCTGRAEATTRLREGLREALKARDDDALRVLIAQLEAAGDGASVDADTRADDVPDASRATS